MPDGRIGRRLPALPAASASSMTDGCAHAPIGAGIAGTPVLRHGFIVMTASLSRCHHRVAIRRQIPE
jgi:hypothetical protein